MRRTSRFAWAALAAAISAPMGALAQPVPLTPVGTSGGTVTPAFEGWYKNRDGTYSLSFGYYSRNTREIVDIPIGAGNYVDNGPQNQGQPTRFYPGRHWGVFAVTVPANFGSTRSVVWHIDFRGERYAIPGALKLGWEIDALEGEAGAGNTPPEVWFAPSGGRGAGPGGIVHTDLVARVGEPLTIEFWATDDGKASTSIASPGRANVPVTLTWFVHQGSGQVTFAPASPAADRATGRGTTSVTFSEPGDYMLRLRANDASGVSGAGHAQCCWTNGFVKVTVTR